MNRYLVVSFLLIFLNASCSKSEVKPNGGNQTDDPHHSLIVCVKDFLSSEQISNALSIMDSEYQLDSSSIDDSRERQLVLKASILVQYIHQEIGMEKVLDMIKSGLLVSWFGSRKVDFCMNRIGV